MRTLLVYRTQTKAFFVYGFAENVRANIKQDELKALKCYALELLSYDDNALSKTLKAGELIEVMDKSILDVVHESAKGLHKAGVMDEVTLKEFDALCLPPIKEYTPAQIKRIRQKTKTSQAVFAIYLNTSKYTVQKWEQGSKKPNGPSLKLLNIVDRKGLDVLA